MTKEEALFDYCLRIGDNGLILGHRISEWCGHGPILEEDIALTNIALDVLGQSRNFLTYAGEVEGKGRTEDDLAYLRDNREFRNVLLVEQPNGDFGRTIARQFLFDVFSYHFYEALLKSTDTQLASFAEKSIKEVRYHLRHSSEWMTRLGDGTEESHRRVQEPLNDLWVYTGELTEMDEVDHLLLKEGIAVDLEKLRPAISHTIDQVLDRATLKRPEDGWMMKGGRKGVHSEHLGFILADMQFMQRAYPGMEW